MSRRNNGSLVRDFLLPANGPHNTVLLQPFDAHCCHMGTAIQHPVPDRVNTSFVIFDIWALYRSGNRTVT